MSHPVEIFGTQDTHDDDGQVIDSLFLETDSPPDIKFAQEPIPKPALDEPTPTTRLISGYTSFPQSAGLPMQMLPADANRKSLTIRIVSQAATPNYNDVVFLADELGKLSYLSGAATNAMPMLNGHQISLDDHTGPVFIAPGPSLQGVIMVMWTAVTI